MLRRRIGNPASAEWLWIAVILLTGALLRFAALGHEGLWCDEAYTALTAGKPIGQMLSDLAAHDDAPPLFYLLEKGITQIAGNSEAALRLLPAAAGVAALLLLLSCARRRKDPALFWAAAFFAVAPYGIFYARQAREYGLLMFLAFVLILSSRNLLRHNARGAGPLLAASGALACLTHHLGVILVCTSVLLWPLRSRGGSDSRGNLAWWRWGLWHLLPLLLWAVWWIGIGGQQMQTHAEGNYWISAYWEKQSILLGPLLSLGAFVPGVAPGVPLHVAFASLGDTHTLWRIVSTGTVLLCLVLAALRIGRSRATRQTEDQRPGNAPPATAGTAGTPGNPAVEWAFFLIPLLALTVVSAIWTPIYVVARTDTIAFAAFALLVGHGLARLPRALAGILVLAWALVSIPSLAPGYGVGDPGRAKGVDRQVARFLADRGLGTGDLLVHGPLTAPTLEYYLERRAVPHTPIWFPATAGRNPAAAVPLSPDSLERYVDEARRLRQRMEQQLPANGAAWILGIVGASDTTTVAQMRATELTYPTSILLYHLVGLTPQKPLLRYRQDWIGGERAIFRVPREAWVPVEDLPPLRMATADMSEDAS
jgi:hypothetical protein